MNLPAGLFEDDLRNLRQRGQHEVRVFDGILTSVSHVDDEGSEGNGSEQGTDTSFHGSACLTPIPPR